MRPQISKLVALGKLPAEDTASVEQLREYQAQLESIVPPVNHDEAAALVGLFGDDGCFGLAWTLVHLVETAPGWPIGECLADTGNQWIAQLSVRSANAR